MRTKICLFSLIFFLSYSVIHAQPDENYIHKLTGDVNLDWLKSVGNSLSNQTISWSSKSVQGFNNTSSLARKQAILQHPWFFYPVDSKQNSFKPTEIKFPHHFEKVRSYKAGWYFTKYTLDEFSKKRLVLMLNRVDLFSMVYLNGNRIGYHFGSYTPFEFDITNASVAGDNVLAIFVHDRSAAVDGDKAYNQLGPEWLKSSYSQGRANDILKGGMDDAPILELRENISLKDVFIKTSTRTGEMQIEYELAFKNNKATPSTLSFEVMKWPNGERVNLQIPDVAIDEVVEGSYLCNVNWPNPDLWSPENPNLYILRTTIKNGKSTDVVETRFGFREFWNEGKTFMLNGIPIKLRGESTFRPIITGEGGYKKTFELYKQLFGSNACRIHATMPHGDMVLAADEAGILLIDQSAIWSVNVMFYKNGGEWFLKNTEKEFEEWVKRDRNSPSVVIWDVENEMLRYNYEMHLPWVSKLPGFIKKYDTTRPFNFSGAGWFSNQQDMVSLHMQEHYTRIMKDWNQKGTCPLLMGEFWVGGRMEQRIPTSLEFTSAKERYVEEAKIYEEKLLEMRYLQLSGVMPFRISLLGFYRGEDATNPNLLTRTNDVIQKIQHGMQPVTVFFWPRRNYTSASKTFKRELVICNDSETEKIFDISWGWENQADKVKSLTLQPAEQRKITIEDTAPLKDQKLIATLQNNGKIISTDTLLIHPIVLPASIISKKIKVYQDEGLVKILSSKGFSAQLTTSIPKAGDKVIFIIPEHANNRVLNSQKIEILDFLRNGGTVLCLKQDQAPSWFPLKFEFWSANQTSPHTYARMGWQGLHKNLFYSKIAPLLAPTHPIFNGINGSNLHLWDNYDGRVSDDVFVRPANVNKFQQGNWRPLAAGTRREHVSIVELFYGEGTLLSCQLNIMDNIDNIQASSLFVNMLSYLSDKPAAIFNNKVAVRGSLNPMDLSILTGAAEATFRNAQFKKNDLMLAFNGSDITEIKEWAVKGGKVLVLSDSLSQAFEGVKMSHGKNKRYLATKIADHTLLQGVSSANFLQSDQQFISSYFTAIPSNAKVLLQGFDGASFWRLEEVGPVMISIPFGKGEIILSALNIEKQTSVSAQELLSLILTNQGVPIPFANTTNFDEVIIKKTVPITIDGILNEWLEDMEDKNVTQYIHAQPVFLTSENIIKGPPEFDLNLSAINYFLWNEKALYIAGVVFGEELTYETGISYGSEKIYNQEFKLNDDVISISVKNKMANVLVNGVPISNEWIGVAQINSNEMTDATNLHFNYILASGKIASVQNLIGETFELMIPWQLLKHKSTDESVRSIVSLESKETKIQVPLAEDSSLKSNWLKMKYKKN